jgi:hypothetical protein
MELDPVDRYRVNNDREIALALEALTETLNVLHTCMWANLPGNPES